MKITYALPAIFLGIFTVLIIPSVAAAQAQGDLDLGENIFAPPFSVDLKVNGSDGPIEITRGERITVSWVTEGAARCRSNFSQADLSFQGTTAGRVITSVVVRIACLNDAHERLDDFVLVNVRGKAAVTAPVLPSHASNQSLPESVSRFSPCGLKGDVDGDGWVTQADIAKIRDFAIGKTVPSDIEKAAADLNNDGKIDTLNDVIPVTKYLIGQIQSFPGCVFTPKEIPPSCGTKGDLNNDKKIDNEDVIILRDSILGKRALPSAVFADLTGEGNVTTLDITRLRRYLLDLDQTFGVCSTVSQSHTPASEISHTVQTLSTEQQIAALPDDFKKGLVCGQKGDVDNDGYITKKDYDLVFQSTLGRTILDDEQTAAADVNGLSNADGTKVTTLDGVAIASYLLGRSQSFTGCVFVPKEIPVSCGAVGDVNADTKIDNSDVLLIRNHVLGLNALTGTPLSSADVNGDHSVTTLDITFLRRYLLNLDTTFPACNVPASAVQPTITVPTVTAPPPSPASASKPLVCGSLGDVNNDGAITQADIDLSRTFILGTATPTDEQTKAADVNASGGISTLDNSLISAYINGTRTTFPGCSAAANN